MRFIRGPAAGALYLLAGCTAETPPLTAPAHPPDPKTQMAALERRIFELVEDERHKLDPVARPLALDLELVGVAREKSADMAAKSYVAHAAPDGETTATIIMDKDAAFQGLLGENIASQPFLPAYGLNVETFARRIVQTWVASSQHRDNLADPSYDRTGVGAAVSRDTIYVTELFAGSPELTPPSEPPRPPQHGR